MQSFSTRKNKIMIELERKSLLVGLFLITILGFSINASAQTSGLIPIGFKHMGEASIDNVKVEEKQYYNIIHARILLKIPDLALEDGDALNGAIILQNNNGKTYGGTLCDYQNPGEFSHFTETSIVGTEGGIKKPTFCYNVEKEFNQFTVYLQQYSNANTTYHKYQIGRIDLNQNQNPITNAGSYAQKIVNDTSSYAKNIVNNASSYAKNINMTQPKDFFAQLFDWLKSLFHFS